MALQETGQQVAVRDGHRIVGIYSPSPIEFAFDVAIQNVFDASLHDGVIDNDGHLVRVSSPVHHNNDAFVFQYTRYNPLISEGASDKIVALLLPHNPVLGAAIGDLTSPEAAGVDPMSDEFFERIDRELVFLDGVQQRVIDRDGELNPLSAVLDPSYFTEGTPIRQWPESVEFAIFDGSKVDQQSPPTALTGIGKFGTVIPRIHGDIMIEGSFAEPFSDDATRMVLSYPQEHHNAARAYSVVFDKMDFGDDADYYLPPETGMYLGIKIPIIAYKPNPTELQNDLHSFVAFAKELSQRQHI